MAVMNVEIIRVGDYLDTLTDYHANGSYKVLKANVNLLDEENYAVMVRTLNFERDDFSDLKYIDQHAYEFLGKSKVYPDDILMNKIANPGSIYIMPNLNRPVSCGMNLFLLRFNNELNQRYMYYCMKNSEAYIKSFAHGTATKTITKKEVMNLLLRIHPRNEQDKIAAFLDKIQQKIDINQSVNENLLQQAEAIYKAWFCDRFAEDESSPWPKTTIGDITSLVVRGITPKYNDDTDQLIINQKCIRNHMVDLTPARRHLPKAITEKWLIQGDLLINSTGEGTLGRAAQVWFVPNNLTVDSHVTIVRPKTAVLRNYIGLWGLTHEAEIESLHTGSTGQTELPRERVKAMELPLPDESALSRFNELITPMTQAIVKNQQENVRLAELRDTLLPRLMSGELDVSVLDI